jgi:hypothetical protein
VSPQLAAPDSVQNQVPPAKKEKKKKKRSKTD